MDIKEEFLSFFDKKITVTSRVKEKVNEVLAQESHKPLIKESVFDV